MKTNKKKKNDLIIDSSHDNIQCLISEIKIVGARCSVFGRANRRSAVGFLLLQRFSKCLAVEYSSCFISVLELDLYVCCLD